MQYCLNLPVAYYKTLPRSRLSRSTQRQSAGLLWVPSKKHESPSTPSASNCFALTASFFCMARRSWDCRFHHVTPMTPCCWWLTCGFKQMKPVESLSKGHVGLLTLRTHTHTKSCFLLLLLLCLRFRFRGWSYQLSFPVQMSSTHKKKTFYFFV